MKFLGTNGGQYHRQVDKSTYRRKEVSKSELQQRFGDKIQQLFPNYNLLEEVPCFGSNLYLDFFIPQLRIAFEIQGQQHDNYVPFFHKSRQGYADSKKRDVIKAQWCELNNIKLIELNEKDYDNLKEVLHERIN